MTISHKAKKGKSVAACLILCLLLLCLLALGLTSCDLFASEIYLETFNVDMTLTKEGSLLVTEKSHAVFAPQDTTWWNFYRVIDDRHIYENIILDDSSFRVDGRAVEFSDMPLDLDSSSSDYWKRTYADKTFAYFNYNDNGLELGFILPEFSSGRHTFEYTYEIENYLTGGADAAIFYHKYLSEINGMDVKGLNVTLHFPEAEPSLKAWLHVSQNAVGAWKLAEDEKSLVVHVEDIKAGEYVESRVLLDKSHYTLSSVDASLTSVDIEREETEWKEAYEREEKIRLAVTIADYVLGAAALLFGIAMIFVFKKKSRPLELPDAPIYYRDIPEGYTGGEVSPMYFYYSSENYIDESISATMLELVRKQYISILPDEKAKSARVTVLKKDEDDEIPTHQKYVIEMLLMVKPLGESFTMKQFESFGKNNPGKMIRMVQKYREAILNKSKREGAYPKKNQVLEKVKRFVTGCVVSGVAVIVLSGFANFFFGQGMTVFGVGLILGGLVSYLFLHKIKPPLTVTGQKEYDKLHALGKYMQEFSMMEDHEIPELVLWEDYMVFATAMGIADKVAKQLEIAYPEFKTMSARSFDNMDGLFILYFFSPSFRVMSGLNFVGNISNVLRSANAAERALRAGRIAKGLGGIAGGGFHGGGGGFHGGGGGFSGGGFGGRR